jgi:hypothetical protein
MIAVIPMDQGYDIVVYLLPTDVDASVLDINMEVTWFANEEPFKNSSFKHNKYYV